MTQAEEMAYWNGYHHGRKADDGFLEKAPKKTDNPYKDDGLREAWDKGFSEGRIEYLESQRYF